MSNPQSATRCRNGFFVKKLYWFKHNCKDGQYPSYLVHDSIKINKKNDIDIPKSFDDYEIKYEQLANLDYEEF